MLPKQPKSLGSWRATCSTRATGPCLPPTATVECEAAPSGGSFVCKVPFAEILQKPSSTSTKDLLAGICPNGDREGLGFYLAFSGTVSAAGSDEEIPFKQQYPCKPGARTTDRKCT
jgi:hypothetical protein